MPRADLKLSARAERDLIELRRYSFQEFGKVIADRYVDDIEAAFTLLSDNPRAGAAQPDYGRGIRAFSRRKHRIIYRISGNTLQIVRVLHVSRDVNRALRQ